MALPDFAPRPDDAAIAELEPVLRAFRSRHPEASDRLIHQAYETAFASHAGQFRKSGEPFITHPLAVTLVLAEYGLDAETLAASLLHDVVEDTELTLGDVRVEFGDTVAELIDGVTKLDRVKFSNREEAQAATIRKMVIAMARDVRVLLIKLADRLHNVRTLDALDADKQQRIAEETLDVYAPLAHRLGVQEIKHEMEDRCFAILHPGRYAEIQDLLRRRAPERDASIQKVIEIVRGMLDDGDIDAEVTGRPKHSYSIYRKMVDGGRSFDDIHDLIGIRIITDEVSDCYAALGLVHTRWPPVHGRFKDFIAMPKFNLYQSLHTTVLGPERRPLEVQIRTREMHERAERGIAAHWRYKEGDPGAAAVASIAMLTDEFDDPREFLQGLKIDLYQDEVFVLTPAGDVKTLPRGATPVDFAYAIHTEVGHKTSGARVNGRLMPLDTRLESGDIVEVITSRGESGPSRDWLKFVRTSRASAKIRQWFSRERRQHAIAEGREAVAKLLRREGLGLSAVKRDTLLEEVAEGLGYKDLDGMYQAVGEHNVQPATVLQRLGKLVEPPEEPEPEALDVGELPPPTHRPPPGSRGVVVEGLEDMYVRLARCCSPVPGDSIIGFVTVGRGVSVHRDDCTNIASLGEQEERMIDVAWGAAEIAGFTVWLQIEALDRTRLLRDVTAALSDLGANIVSSSSSTGRDRVAVLRYEVELSDAGQIDRVLDELRGVDGVYDAYRLLPGGGRG
ncbi:MAG: bifunctional (p)ppGpp synthetase/guanosine-3',5'-bis(diphosphate) 3'-pyrophosphohydrolase [Acidimicrobiia bacterium]|nr:bifunctional (p)ppGpp synthetase/guanosine-3',5'-bis(diphosphate) 3'-pyrophosphohydrolase [Acidimicrobiia bacterium]